MGFEISLITPAWPFPLAINRALLGDARLQKVEAGEVIRLDSMVTEALTHEPSDSSLLWDAVRIIVRLLKAAEGLAGIKSVWRPAAGGEALGLCDPVHERASQAGSTVSRSPRDPGGTQGPGLVSVA
jgi:IS5 family transposase